MSTPASQPQYGGYTPPQQDKKGMAIASLVLGILALVGCLIPVLNIVSIILGIIAIILGIVALRAIKQGRAGGKGMAIAGIVLSILAILGAILINVLLGALVIEQQETVSQALHVAELSVHHPVR